jgi:hypothetical protein
MKQMLAALNLKSLIWINIIIAYGTHLKAALRVLIVTTCIFRIKYLFFFIHNILLGWLTCFDDLALLLDQSLNYSIGSNLSLGIVLFEDFFDPFLNLRLPHRGLKV